MRTYAIDAVSWLATTRSVLFAPRVFFEQLRGQDSLRSSVVYLLKTAFAVSLINAVVLAVMFYVLVSAFTSIFSALIVVVGTLLTPLIAVAANMSPEKVPAAVANFAKDGGLLVPIISAKLGVLLFAGQFCTIIASTSIHAGVAHGIARLLGSSRTFSFTAAAYAFSSAAWMLSIIPAVNLIAPVYGAVLDVIAMRLVHQLSIAKATVAVILAVVAPAVVCILYSCMTH